MQKHTVFTIDNYWSLGIDLSLPISYNVSINSMRITLRGLILSCPIMPLTKSFRDAILLLKQMKTLLCNTQAFDF